MASVGLQLQTKLQTRLTLTPELKTAIELLQLPQIELEQRIEQEMEDNPLLEWEDALAALPDPGDYDRYRREGTDFAERTDHEDYDRFERMILNEPGLHAHLEWQVHIAPWDEVDKDLALDLVPMFGPDGYLREPDSELAEQFGVPEAQVARVRSLFHTLEPAGLAARNLAECLLVQLREQGDADCLATRVLQTCCDELEAGDMDAIAEKLAVDPAELAKALAALRHLDPRPGARFRDDTADPIQPELKIERKENGDWHVEPYKPWSHRIRCSPVMHKLQTEPESFSKKEIEYIKAKARSAEYFLNSLKQRELTLLRVAEAIIERQATLLDDGPDAATPLTLKDIAEAVDLHESTVSRVTRRKYAITPRGIMELKGFFRQSVGGGDHTSEMIKHRIQDLISRENPARPFSDQVIANLLTKEGMEVARRTVAKYRTELNIPSRSERKH